MERRIIDLGSNRAGARGTTDRLVSPPVCFRPFDRARVSLRALEMVQPICKAILFFFFFFFQFRICQFLNNTAAGDLPTFRFCVRLSMIDEPLLLLR